ncbi:Hydroxyproline-rich glycoprotein family protein isoform 2 [Theobroma cacao]|uniref:Hydroxyproline-rich glycoprotein family protein isoform 2 n=1 Tax=Theobroma cacao TaxID=3641 RepID=A0A061G255_THECC|nr:Hydroxyproline-rich glycoprotein family protein isoform 2 [Theobroma cacao]
MRSVNDSVETVNAAATAIVSADSRVQPTTVQVHVYKKRWGSCWGLYWCFGSQKNSKRIGHAVLVPEPVVPGASVSTAENVSNPTGIILPFIAPPSSPASFLQSDPPSATQSPAGLLSLTSLSVNAYSPRGPASIFAIGPYAHETQLVTPPVFSALTTEPSTAPFTPPPESVQLTTPSSPEVPFAQLLTSSLERARRNSGINQKFGLSHYEFQSYQIYPGSPGGNLISPGSAISNSGTSSPFPDRRPILEFRMGEAPKLLGFENFTTRKWGSRLGSGSLTPDGLGQGSRLGSGSVTPDGMGLGSRLGSGSLTPDGLGPASRDGFLVGSQISEVALLANPANGPKNDETIVDHRVSFELSGEDVAPCLESKSLLPSRAVSEYPKDLVAEGRKERDGIKKDLESSCELFIRETSNETVEKASGEAEEEHSYQKHRSVTLGSIKEFNFDNTKGEASDKPTIRSEWWANEKVAGKEARPGNSWTFFPMLQPEVS